MHHRFLGPYSRSLDGPKNSREETEILSGRPPKSTGDTAPSRARRTQKRLVLLLLLHDFLCNIMVDYEDSSQLKLWLFKPEQLEKCRERANRQARVFLAAPPSEQTAADSDTTTPPVNSFAAGYANREDMDTTTDNDDVPTKNAKRHDFVTPQEEGLLIAFYASKLPSLIGPLAQVPRLRRDAKVTATAALLFRRFFLSNSVMMYDPKAVMVAAAFLGSKAEDATSDVRFDRVCASVYPYLDCVQCSYFTFPIT